MYLLGINIPDEKRVDISLSYIYGLGKVSANRICNQLEIHPQCRLKDLNESKITLLSKLLNTMHIEAELKRSVGNNIQKLVSIGSYRGQRHEQGKPVNGQRTRGNASTAKMLNGKGIVIARTSNSNNCSKLIKLDALGILSVNPLDYLSSSSNRTPDDSSLFTKLLDHLDRIGFENGAQVAYAELVTTPRFLGFSFNPLSTWFLYNAKDEILGVLLEVNNTFKEKHVYLCYPGNEIKSHLYPTSNLDKSKSKERLISKTYSIPRSFHVSPFNNRTGRYLAKISKSSQSLDILLNIMDYQHCQDSTITTQSLLLTARVHGQAYVLDACSLAYLMLVYPMNCLLTLPRISYQAFLLSYRKGLAVYTRPTPINANVNAGDGEVVEGLTIGKRRISRLQKYALEKVLLLWQEKGVFEEIGLIVPDVSQIPPHLHHLCSRQQHSQTQSKQIHTIKVENWNAFVYFFTQANHFRALFMAFCRGECSAGSPAALETLVQCLLRDPCYTHSTRTVLLDDTPSSSQKTCLLVPRTLGDSVLFFAVRWAVAFEWALFKHSGARFVEGSDAWGLDKRCRLYIIDFFKEGGKNDIVDGCWNGLDKMMDDQGTYLERERKRAMHFLSSLV